MNKVLLVFALIATCYSSFANSKKYIDDFDFDSVEDYLRINYDESKKIYDRIEFHLSAHGDFEYTCDKGYDCLSNNSEILIDNDRWEAGYWELYYRIKRRIQLL